MIFVEYLITKILTFVEALGALYNFEDNDGLSRVFTSFVVLPEQLLMGGTRYNREQLNRQIKESKRRNISKE